MYRTVFSILFLGHILGDFYFQTQKAAKLKEKSIKKALTHCALYAFACFIVILPAINKWLSLAAAFLSISHLIIDLFKCAIIRSFSKYKEKEPILYITDQALHLICIIAAAIFVAANCNTLNVPYGIDYIFEVIGTGKSQALSSLLLILLVWKPANITIKKLLASYKPEEEPENNADKNAGGFIGFLERIVILLFLSIGQYSAIGLVLTAKSIARYNKISEDKQFAEYYLLGTLLSAAIAIFSYFVLF
ncbi:MAG TPA: DUF3307 domain-containing protein [Clostridiales bacterium]|nr:DUF3307 domain-containing protein [Clostridiales bacterium]